MVKEELSIEHKVVIYYDHMKNKGEVKLEGTETLNIELNGKKISFVKYISSNSVLADNAINNVFKKFIDFVNNMQCFGSLEKNYYQGLKSGSDLIAKGIIESGKLQEFELFLRKVGIEYKLIKKEVDGEKLLFCDYHGHEINFFSIASRGTFFLSQFFYCLIDIDKVSLIYVDEFDAFYHNDVAKMLIQEVLKSKVQSIITAHNTSIIDNDILRPDCYFNLVNGKIYSFAELTHKELRKAHNIEKMYRAGSFL